MVAGPETARLLNEYQGKYVQKKEKHDRHHEQIPSIQKAFITDVKSAINVMEEAGNPFKETSSDLLKLDTKVLMSNEVIEAVRTAEDIGKHQYQRFVEERLNDNVRSFYDSMTRNSLPLFKTGPKKFVAVVGVARAKPTARLTQHITKNTLVKLNHILAQCWKVWRHWLR